MLTPADLEELPAQARKVLGPTAPKPLKLMAAKGIIPGVKPAHLIALLLALENGEDAEVGATARATLNQLPAPLLNGALDVDLPEAVIDRLAEACVNQHDVLEKLLRQPRIAGATLVMLALRADERAGELIATNEELMLRHPSVIEKLYLNKQVRMSTADRLLELAVRNGLELNIAAFKEAAAAIKNELIPEPSEEPTFDDELFREAEALAEQIELDDEDDTHELDDEGQEQLKRRFLPLYASIAQMSVTQKIRRAMLGSSAERMLLIRDSNRLVSEAAAKSPLMRDNDAIRVSANRSVSDGVLRIIANNRDFTRNYQVKLNLVVNPRTPFAFASRLVQHLRDNDLRSLAKSKNITGAVLSAVRQQLIRKQNGKT